MKDYVIRIYHREKKDRPKLVGTVKEVGVEGSKDFCNLNELWEVLNSSETKTAKTKKRSKSLKHGKHGEL